jgi:CubicO group peptidase (beta-lactamase class C family)
MGAAVVRKNGTIKVGVSGIRRHGYQTRVAANDRWHIGSDTKAMTATLAAILVDRGVIGWQTTLAEAFPELSGGMNAAYRTIKLIELLRHRGGIPAGHAGQDGLLWKEDESNRTRRYLFTEAVTAGAPSHVPGGKFVYSNAGYIIAAAMLEKRADRDWADMMRTELFQPLGAKHTGFGPPETEIVALGPGAPAIPRQPWGHGPMREIWDGNQNRPPAAAPAGDVHASLRDWGRFILLHLNGQHGELKLSSNSTVHLHTPQVTDPSDPSKYDAYAAGWGTDVKGRYFHDGSIGFWYSRAIFHKIQGYGILVIANMGGETVVKATDALEERLMQYMGY